MASKPSASFRLPWPYVIWNFYAEPISAFGALCLALCDPLRLLAIFTPTYTPNDNCPVPTTLSPHASLLLYQTCSLYALFVVLESGLSRWTVNTSKIDRPTKMQILRLLQLGVLSSDVFYIGASWKLYSMCGADELFWKPWLWYTREWMNLGMTWLPLFQRVAFLMGVGLRGVHGAKRRKRRTA